MSRGLIQGDIRQEWRLVPLGDVVVRERQRPGDPAHVETVKRSFRELGGQLQLQPIVLTGELVLIDGWHRLRAAQTSGWDFISSVLLHGATEEDRHLLEAESNRVRKQLAPIELEEAWRKYYEPAFKAQARQKQVANLRQGPIAPVSGITGNGEPAMSVSLVRAARETTGMDLDWLTKISDIRSLAHSSSAPQELRDAAMRGLQKLARPGQKVDPIHKELLRLQEAFARRSEDASTIEVRRLEHALDRTVTDTTLLAERLAGPLGRDLTAAARVAPAGHETLRAVRVALTHALAEIVAVECLLEPDAGAALNRFGGEVTRLLSRLTVSRLRLEAPDDRS